MLDNINRLMGRGKEEKLQREAEQREQGFIRERDGFRTAMESDTMAVEAQRSDLLKWQQDLGDEMENLKHRLRSEELSANGWQPKAMPQKVGNKVVWVRIPPLANELFIDSIQSQVEPFVSRNLLNSNFDEARILTMLENTCNDISDLMADGFDLFDIEFQNYDAVMRLIINTIIPGPFRALHDGERKHARTISKRIESFNEGDSQNKKKSLFGFGG